MQIKHESAPTGNNKQEQPTTHNEKAPGKPCARAHTSFASNTCDPRVITQTETITITDDVQQPIEQSQQPTMPQTTQQQQQQRQQRQALPIDALSITFADSDDARRYISETLGLIDRRQLEYARRTDFSRTTTYVARCTLEETIETTVPTEEHPVIEKRQCKFAVKVICEAPPNNRYDAGCIALPR